MIQPVTYLNAEQVFGDLRPKSQSIDEQLAIYTAPVSYFQIDMADYLKMGLPDRVESIKKLYLKSVFTKRQLLMGLDISFGLGKDEVEKAWKSLLPFPVPKECGIMLFPNHIHFLMDGASYRANFGGDSAGLLLPKDFLKNDASNYSGTVSVGHDRVDDTNLTARHECYHGLVHFFPASTYLENLRPNAKLKGLKDPNLTDFLQRNTLEEFKTWHSCLDNPEDVPKLMNDHNLNFVKTIVHHRHAEAVEKGYSILTGEKTNIMARSGKKLEEKGVELIKKLRGQGIPKEKIQLAMEVCDLSEFPDRVPEIIKYID